MFAYSATSYLYINLEQYRPYICRYKSGVHLWDIGKCIAQDEICAILFAIILFV